MLEQGIIPQPKRETQADKIAQACLALDAKRDRAAL